MGVNVVQPEGDVLGVFVFHFHNGKCHRIADGEMFSIRMRKLDNISVRSESSIHGLFADVFGFNIDVGFRGNYQNKNSESTKIRNLPAPAAKSAVPTAHRITSNTCLLRRHRSSASRGFLLQEIRYL